LLRACLYASSASLKRLSAAINQPVFICCAACKYFCLKSSAT
jgi:hypothetical protein